MSKNPDSDKNELKNPEPNETQDGRPDTEKPGMRWVTTKELAEILGAPLSEVQKKLNKR